MTRYTISRAVDQGGHPITVATDHRGRTYRVQVPSSESCRLEPWAPDNGRTHWPAVRIAAEHHDFAALARVQAECHRESLAMTATTLPRDEFGEPTLSDRLRRVLDARGCSIAEAARMARMERQQVWRIVAGETPNPGVATVERLVTAIGATMAELFEDE